MSNQALDEPDPIFKAVNGVVLWRWESWKHVHLNWPFNPLPIYKLEGHPRDLFA